MASLIGLPLAAAAAAFSLSAAPVIETLPEATWLSPFDYPIAITGPKVSGTIVFLLTFGADGRLSACDILKSSGNAMLDMVTCRLSRQRVRVSASQPHVQFFQHHWS